jgi:hypothetical protein
MPEAENIPRPLKGYRHITIKSVSCLDLISYINRKQSLIHLIEASTTAMQDSGEINCV